MATSTNRHDHGRYTEQVCANCAGDEFLEAALVTSLRRCRVGFDTDGLADVDYVEETELDSSVHICCATCGTELTCPDDLIPAGTPPRRPEVVKVFDDTYGFDPSMVAMLRMVRSTMPERFDALMELVRDED